MSVCHQWRLRRYTSWNKITTCDDSNNTHSLYFTSCSARHVKQIDINCLESSYILIYLISLISRSIETQHSQMHSPKIDKGVIRNALQEIHSNYCIYIRTFTAIETLIQEIEFFMSNIKNRGKIGAEKTMYNKLLSDGLSQKMDIFEPS